MLANPAPTSATISLLPTGTKLIARATKKKPERKDGLVITVTAWAMPA